MSTAGIIPRTAGVARKPFTTEDEMTRRDMLRLRSQLQMIGRVFAAHLGLQHTDVAKREAGKARWTQDEIARAKQIPKP